jgi:glucokinase
MASRKKRRFWVGVDLGGTKMLSVVYDQDFKPLGRCRKKTQGHEGAQAGLSRMIDVISEALVASGVSSDQLAGIGVGCPGPLDLNRGIVLETPNLGWKNAKVAKTLRKAFGCRTLVANDVDVGVYGEYLFGAARGARCVVGVFPGTGIGGGCVYQGDILRGTRGSCMEIGHIPVIENGPLCGCGQRGCLEAVAGRLAISSAAARAAYRGEAPYLLQNVGCDISEIRSGSLRKSVEAGDAAVETIIRDAATNIGQAMAGVVNLLAPDVVLLGGGLVEEMPDLFRQEVSAAIKKRAMPAFKKSFKLVTAELGDDASVKGAAAWARHAIVDQKTRKEMG